jgi:hypothetical protein
MVYCTDMMERSCAVARGIHINTLLRALCIIIAVLRVTVENTEQ